LVSNVFHCIFNKPEAENDILQAVEWYESRQLKLGLRFLTQVEVLYGLLELNPFLFPEKYRKVRQAPLKNFPYVVLYKVEDENVFVLAVFNCYRDPRKKKLRLK
jgi:hypothetical protein